MPPAEARALLARDPVKNARALLRNALPINNKAARQIQASIWRCVGAALVLFSACFCLVVQTMAHVCYIFLLPFSKFSLMDHIETC